ncbi:MAG: hypothetical protein L0Z62_36945 [Gemmataceae bacterium]|nr:hypothetical protein [Gemmataceae bacterium]
MFRIGLLTLSLAGLALVGSHALAQEKADDLARKVAGEFIQGLRNGDVERLLKVSDVPWTTDGESIVKERERLKEMLQRTTKRGDGSKDKIRDIILITTLSGLETKMMKERGRKLRPERRKAFEEVLGKEHRIVVVETERRGRMDAFGLLIRIEKGKVRVVGAFE